MAANERDETGGAPQTTGGGVELSIVLPVANGATFVRNSLRELADHLAQHYPSSEIVVVDDGSSDDTARCVAESVEGCRVPVTIVHHEQNQGKGAAVRTGMRAARGRYRLFMDADMAYPPAEIGVVVERLRAGADVVIASRVHGESRYLIRPSFFRYLYTRHIAGRLFNWLVRLLLLPGITDTQAGLKGFTGASAEMLFAAWTPDGFGFDLAVLARARRLGLTVAEVPVTFRYDREPTTMRFLADTFGMLRDLALVRLRIGHGGAIPATGKEALEPDAQEAGGRPMAWRQMAALMLALVAVELARAFQAPLLVPLGLWLLALGMWLGQAFSRDRAGGVPPATWFSGWREVAVVVGITAFAAVLRLAALDEIPAFIHHDAAAMGLVGRELLSGPQRDPFALALSWYRFPYLGLLPYAVTLKLMGTTVFALRLASALPGLLLVPALYFLVREWFGRPTATIAAALLAANHTAVHFSRSGIWNIHALLLGVVSFAAIFGGWRRRSRFWLSVAGVTAGLSLYTYTAGRLFFGLGVLTVAWLGWRRSRPADRRLAGYFVVALAATVAPLAGSYLRVPVAFSLDRQATVSPFSEAYREHVASQVGSNQPAAVLWYQARRTLGAFVSSGDTSSNYGINSPLISPITAALALLGIFLALARLPDPRLGFLLVWLALGLLFGSVLAVNPPNFPRLLAVLPVPIVLASAVLGKAWERFRTLGLVTTVGATALVVAVLSVSLIANARAYLRFCHRVETTVDEWVVLQEVQRLAPMRTIYFFTGPALFADSPAFELWRDGRRFVYGLTVADLPESLVEPTAFILAPDYRSVGLAISERFPDLERSLVANRGVRLLTTYHSMSETDEKGALP